MIKSNNFVTPIQNNVNKPGYLLFEWGTKQEQKVFAQLMSAVLNNKLYCNKSRFTFN